MCQGSTRRVSGSGYTPLSSGGAVTIAPPSAAALVKTITEVLPAVNYNIPAGAYRVRVFNIGQNPAGQGDPFVTDATLDGQVMPIDNEKPFADVEAFYDRVNNQQKTTPAMAVIANSNVVLVEEYR